MRTQFLLVDTHLMRKKELAAGFIEGNSLFFFFPSAVILALLSFSGTAIRTVAKVSWTIQPYGSLEYHARLSLRKMAQPAPPKLFPKNSRTCSISRKMYTCLHNSREHSVSRHNEQVLSCAVLEGVKDSENVSYPDSGYVTMTSLMRSTSTKATENT